MTQQELSKIVLDYISRNQIRGKMPGIIKLSRELGVNRVTLGRVFHLLEQQGILEIRGTGGSFVVEPCLPERQHIIGLIGLGQEIEHEKIIFNEVRILAEQAGYHVIGISFDETLFKSNPKGILNFSVDAFLFRYSLLSPEIAAALHQAKIPVVALSQRCDLPWLDYCEPDHPMGYAMLLNHLIHLGHRRIAFLEFARPVDCRYRHELIWQLFKDKLGEDFAPELFYARQDSTQMFLRYGQNYNEVYAENAYKYLFESVRPPTAIIGDKKLLKIIEKNHQIKIPEKLSAVTSGYLLNHDNTYTGVRFDELKMFQWGIRRLLERLSGSTAEVEHIFEAPVWFDGSSTAPVTVQNKDKVVVLGEYN